MIIVAAVPAYCLVVQGAVWSVVGQWLVVLLLMNTGLFSFLVMKTVVGEHPAPYCLINT